MAEEKTTRETGRKLYATPRLVTHGDMEEITKWGGPQAHHVDVPWGEPLYDRTLDDITS